VTKRSTNPTGCNKNDLHDGWNPVNDALVTKKKVLGLYVAQYHGLYARSRRFQSRNTAIFYNFLGGVNPKRHTIARSSIHRDVEESEAVIEYRDVSEPCDNPYGLQTRGAGHSCLGVGFLVRGPVNSR